VPAAVSYALMSSPLPNVAVDSPLIEDFDFHVLCGVPNYYEFNRLIDDMRKLDDGQWHWPFHGDVAEGVRAGLMYLRLPNSPEQLAKLANLGTRHRALMHGLFIAETLDNLASLHNIDGAIFLPVAAEEQYRLLGRQLGADDTTLAFDATYWFTQRCQTSRRLRYLLRDKLFKRRDLIKVGVGVLPNGYIGVVEAPLAAASKCEDADSLLYIVVTNDNVLNYALTVGGRWKLDLGYRGVRLPTTVDVDMPPKREPKGKMGMSFDEVVAQRRSTSQRWVVEVVNALCKNYQRLTVVLRWELIPHARSIFRAVCFLENRFGRRFDF
jgi:hypothetical protein